jgi:hypothetical protein
MTMIMLVSLIGVAVLSFSKVSFWFVLLIFILLVVSIILSLFTHTYENKISDIMSGKVKPIYVLDENNVEPDDDIIYLDGIKYFIYEIDESELKTKFRQELSKNGYLVQAKYAFIAEILFDRDFDIFLTMISDKEFKLNNKIK